MGTHTTCSDGPTEKRSRKALEAAAGGRGITRRLSFPRTMIPHVWATVERPSDGF